jgi:integrase
MAGHIAKRKRGDTIKWRARYPDPTRGGTAQIERTFDRRKEAERWLTEQKSSVHRGLHIDPRDTERRFSRIIDAWRATWLELEPKTKAGYESILNKHVLPRWREARIGALSTDAIQQWINELAKTRSPKTVRNVYGVLRSALNVAVEYRFITTNPCDAVRLPKRSKAKRAMLFLTPPEIASVAEAITPRHKLMVFVSAYVGLRAGEIEALRRKDVDLLHHRLSVVLALKDVNTTSENIPSDEKGLIFGPPKNGEARAVVIPRFLGSMLRAHLDVGQKQTSQGYPAVNDDGELRWTRDAADSERLLFTSTEGDPIRHDNFYRRHFKPAVRAGLPAEKHRLRFHDLRHTCASLLIAQGAHPKAIQDHLGHKDIQTTFNIYGHLLPSVHEALSASLDAAYAGSADQADDLPRIGTTSVSPDAEKSTYESADYNDAPHVSDESEHRRNVPDASCQRRPRSTR